MIERIVEIVATTLRHRGVAVSVDACDTFEDLDIDGIDRATIACDVEEEWGVIFSDRDIERWQTLADIEAGVREKTA